MDHLNEYYKDKLHNPFNNHEVIPVIDDDLFVEDIAPAELIFSSTNTTGSILLAIAFAGCFIEIIRTANPELDHQLRTHNPYVKCCLMAATGVVELAVIKLTRHKYSFFSLANKFVNGAIEDIRLTMYEDDPEYHLINAI